MLYENYETDISKDNLVTVFSKVTAPLCLLGGWAVYLTVNVNYKNDKGRDYHGSKDIDLGFHFEKNETKESLINSAFNQSIKALEGIGFYSVSFRLIQHYHRETKQALTPEQARKVPQYDLFDLYVDPMVDNIPDKIHDVLGVTPADEKLLGLVFEKGQFIEIEEFGVKIRLPKPEVLLATKLISLPRRTKDHKKWKDIADIYALMWYSGTKLADLKIGVLELLTQKIVEKAFSKIEESDYETAADAIGVEKDEVKNVINSFIEKTAPKTMSKDESMNDDKWRIPFNIGYDKFVIINKALYQQQADSKPTTLEKMISLTSLNKTTLISNFSFLKSVGILEDAGTHEYKLSTPLGRDYAKAHFGNDKTLLQSTSLQLIENSHLNSLSDKLKINKNMELQDLYSSIKTLGRFSSGTGVSGMSGPYASGSRTLLYIFRDAGLIPESVEIDVSGQRVGTQTTKKTKFTKSKVKPREKPIEQTPITVNEIISTLGKLTVKDVGTIDINDDDTLGIAEMYLNLLKKKIQSNKESESNEELDSE